MPSICILNSSPPYTGIGKYALNLYKGLRMLGKDVDLVWFESSYNSSVVLMEGVKRVPQKLRIPSYKYNFVFSNYFYFPMTVPAGYDLYHVSSQFLSRVRKFRHPCIISHMDLAPIILPYLYPIQFRILWRALLKWYEKAEKVVTISERSKRELSKFVEDSKIVVSPPGYDYLLYKPIPKAEARKMLGLPETQKIILYVGNENDPRKNVPMLLRAFVKVNRSTPNLLLIKVGTVCPRNGALKSELNILEYEGVREECMSLFYNSADLFVFPSIYEGGFAYPPLEAMACGTPAIVSDDMDIFKDGCSIIAPYNFDGLVYEIERIISDENELSKLSKRALEEAKNYTLDKFAERICKTYEEIL